MDYEYYYMYTISIVVIFSAPMPKSPGGLVVMTSIQKTQVQSLVRTQIFMYAFVPIQDSELLNVGYS